MLRLYPRHHPQLHRLFTHLFRGAFCLKRLGRSGLDSHSLDGIKSVRCEVEVSHAGFG